MLPVALLALMPAFDADHRGDTATDLHVTAAYHETLGPVVDDGQCAYAASGKLGCFDPAPYAAQLSCSHPRLARDGVAWLLLHGDVFAPYDGSAPRTVDLPLWAFDQERIGDAFYVWGSNGTAQELWRWDPHVDTSAQKVLTGPAELSAGLAPWPGRPGCLAIGSYEPVADVCKGTTTLWRWCEAEPTTLEPVLRFPGCSGELRLGADGLWVAGDGHATVYPLDGGAPTTYAAPADEVTLAPDARGVMQSFRFVGGELTVAPAR